MPPYASWNQLRPLTTLGAHVVTSSHTKAAAMTTDAGFGSDN
jgi:hypothetical protein